MQSRGSGTSQKNLHLSFFVCKKMNADASNTTFLFTSESVGEGHPGKFRFTYIIYKMLCVLL